MAKVAMVNAAGGHLTQALAIADGICGRHDVFLCVVGFPAVRNLALDGIRRVYRLPVVFGYRRPFGVFMSLVAQMVKITWVFLKERPDYIISTGAEVALVAFLVNLLLFRRPSLFVESLTRIESPSGAGGLIWRWRLADRVFVQWPDHLEAWGTRAEYHGGLL